MCIRNSDSLPPAVRVVMALDTTRVRHAFKETVSNDATEQADTLNDLSHLKILQLQLKV